MITSSASDIAHPQMRCQQCRETGVNYVVESDTAGDTVGGTTVGCTTLKGLYFVAGRCFWTHSMITKSTAGAHRVHIRIKIARLFPYSWRRGGLLFESRRPAPQLLVRVSIAARERRIGAGCKASTRSRRSSLCAPTGRRVRAASSIRASSQRTVSAGETTT